MHRITKDALASRKHDGVLSWKDLDAPLVLHP